MSDALAFSNSLFSKVFVKEEDYKPFPRYYEAIRPAQQTTNETTEQVYSRFDVLRRNSE